MKRTDPETKPKGFLLVGKAMNLEVGVLGRGSCLDTYELLEYKQIICCFSALVYYV